MRKMAWVEKGELCANVTSDLEAIDILGENVASGSATEEERKYYESEMRQRKAMAEYIANPSSCQQFPIEIRKL